MATCNPESLSRPAIADIPAIRREVRRLRASHWRAGGARLLAALAAAYERGVAAPLRQWRRARRARHELERLDERMLRDIGLHREHHASLTTAAWSRVPMGLHLSRRVDDLLDISGGQVYPRIPEARHERPRDLP